MILRPFLSDDLISRGRRKTVSRGSVLHDVHENCSALGVVIYGKLHLSRLLTSGKEILLKEFGPEECYADLIVFTGEPYPGWLIASEHSEVVEIGQEPLLEYLADSAALLDFFKGISGKVNHLAGKIEILSLKTVKQRIAYLLLTSGELTVSSMARTADYLGCSREAFSRALSEMERKRMVQRHENRVKPLDPRALEDLF